MYRECRQCVDTNSLSLPKSEHCYCIGLVTDTELCDLLYLNSPWWNDFKLFQQKIYFECYLELNDEPIDNSPQGIFDLALSEILGMTIECYDLNIIHILSMLIFRSTLI